MTEEYLTQQALGSRWQLSARKLERWRTLGRGPAWLKIGGQVRYPASDVAAYEGAQLRRPSPRPGTPSAKNGLRKPSPVMIDKAMSVKRNRVGPSIGRLDDATLLSVTRSLAVFLGLT